MASKGDELEKWGADVISGRNKSFAAFIARRVFWGASLLFEAIVRVRVAYYLSGKAKQADFASMVVSVGNLTVGGTGKTPVVEKLSRELCATDRQVAILSRGYKSKSLKEPQSWPNISKVQSYDIVPKVVSDHDKLYLKPPYSGDEPYMLAKNLPGVAVLVDKDRVKAARFAISHLGSNTIVLDDGLQYLKLRHSFDIILLDQNAPFGTDAMLPRGTLREPPRHLRRANLIVITKCKTPDNSALIKRIRKYNKTAGIVECKHEAVEIQSLYTEERHSLNYLEGKKVAAVSGIAVPQSFESLLEKQGADILFHRTFSDHHHFKPKEIKNFTKRSIQEKADLIVTTEKDAVRFPPDADSPDIPIYYLRIEIQILKGQEHWDNAIETITGKDFQHPVEHGYQQMMERITREKKKNSLL